MKPIRFESLVDNRSDRTNASSEVEFVDSHALACGDEGKGILAIMWAGVRTRRARAIASAGLMRSGLAHALHHARHRSVFQKHLADQPLMQAGLSDIAVHADAPHARVM